MAFDYTQQPEFAGPQSETENFDTAEFAVPGWRIGTPPAPNAYPAQVDPARAAIEHTIAAERAADLLRTVPPDATDLTVPVPAPGSRPRRPHRRTRPAEPAADTAEPASTPEDAA
jgi:hypothetical protein